MGKQYFIVFPHVHNPTPRSQPHEALGIDSRQGFVDVAGAAVSQALYAAQVPLLQLQVAGGHLDEPLEELPLRAVLVGQLPQAFPGFVCLPPIAMIIQISAVKIIHALSPLVGGLVLHCNRRITRWVVTVTIRMSRGMRLPAGQEAIPWKRNLAVARR